jgi:hypothetical protein
MFAQHYYALLDQPAGARTGELASLYADGATLSLLCGGGGGGRVAGGAAIAAALGAAGALRHSPATLDWQPLEGGAALLLVNGSLSPRTDDMSLGRTAPFSEALTLVPAAEGRWLIANQFRCVDW